MGGKGINVAAAAHGLELDVQCIGLMGEKGAGSFWGKMLAEGFAFDFMIVPGSIRTSLKVVPRNGQAVTELNEPGAPAAIPCILDAEGIRLLLGLEAKPLLVKSNVQ